MRITPLRAVALVGAFVDLGASGFAGAFGFCVFSSVWAVVSSALGLTVEGSSVVVALGLVVVVSSVLFVALGLFSAVSSPVLVSVD